MLLFDLASDKAASPSNIRIDLKFAGALKEAVTCLLYMEYDNSVRDYL
jgi:hypothetical protein